MKINFLLVWAMAIALTSSVLGQPSPTPKPMATPPPKPMATPVNLKEPAAKCDLGIEMAPALRGITLGMTEKEVADVLGAEIKFEPDSDGYTRSTLVIAKRIPGFEGVNFIEIKTYFGKISEINFGYELEFKSLNEFLDNFSPKLGLPREAWHGNYLESQMVCKDFEMKASTYALPKLVMSDLAAVKAITAAKIKANEDKKKAFKP